MLETNKQVLPDLSVIVCCFNHATWIERCIRSILHQELIDKDDFEIILVDDKSTDNSVEVIENLLPIRNLNFIPSSHIGKCI